MKNFKIDFSKYELVNFLWSNLIENLGFQKARTLVTQAIDQQKMNGKKNVTRPIIFTGTGGVALIPIDLVKRETRHNNIKTSQVLIFSPKAKSFQILYDAK